MKDMAEYEELAREMGAFLDIELEILKESLLACAEGQKGSCSLAEVRDGKILAGFALLVRAANTDYTWDVSAFCVDPAYRDKGIGARLVQLLEEDCLRSSPSAILRFETSSRKIEGLGRDLLPRAGYSLIGHIVDFYGKGDDYFIYARHLLKPRTEAPSTPPVPEAAPPGGEGKTP